MIRDPRALGCHATSQPIPRRRSGSKSSLSGTSGSTTWKGRRSRRLPGRLEGSHCSASLFAGRLKVDRDGPSKGSRVALDRREPNVSRMVLDPADRRLLGVEPVGHLFLGLTRLVLWSALSCVGRTVRGAQRPSPTLDVQLIPWDTLVTSAHSAAHKYATSARHSAYRSAARSTSTCPSSSRVSRPSSLASQERASATLEVRL